MTDSDYAVAIFERSRALRERAPLVHNITNLVVQKATADAIAAVGGSQITLHTLEEAAQAAQLSGALALNLGTLDERLLHCARIALDSGIEAGRPWVLDPVAAGLTTFRTEAAAELLKRGPTVLKGNASEILVLAGAVSGGRGADSLHAVAEAADAAVALALRHRCIVVVTGAEDLVTDGRRRWYVANGNPLLGRMIGSGCMLTSVLACFLALGEAPLDGALAAVAWFAVAGEVAAERAGGPGTLAPLLIDALYGLELEDLRQRLVLRDEP